MGSSRPEAFASFKLCAVQSAMVKFCAISPTSASVSTLRTLPAWWSPSSHLDYSFHCHRAIMFKRPYFQSQQIHNVRKVMLPGHKVWRARVGRALHWKTAEKGKHPTWAWYTTCSFRCLGQRVLERISDGQDGTTVLPVWKPLVQIKSHPLLRLRCRQGWAS